MRFFHKHAWSTFTCKASEIEGIKLIGANDLLSKEIFLVGNIADHRCPKHPYQALQSDGECRSCYYTVKSIPPPKLEDVLITYKVCLTCGDYDVIAQCGKFKYTVNKEYIKLKIEALKKEKEDEETERLLNLGNPDYVPKNKNAIKISEYQKIIDEQKETIKHLQTYTRNLLEKLNNSEKNDGIWAAIPEKTKKELIKKYAKVSNTVQTTLSPEEKELLNQVNEYH